MPRTRHLSRGPQRVGGAPLHIRSGGTAKPGRPLRRPRIHQYMKLAEKTHLGISRIGRDEVRVVVVVLKDAMATGKHAGAT